jgi:GNAT superfamily N-acetyltransferase
MTVAIAIKKIKRNFRDFGIGAVITKGTQYVLRNLYVNRSYRLYRRDLSKTQWPQLSSEGIVFKIVESKDSDAIRQIENMEEWLLGLFPEYLSHGLCVAAFDGPLVIGFNLIAFREVFIPLLNMRKRLQPHQAWSSQISVLKAYRSQGLASALRYRVFSELAKRGIRLLYGGALVSNAASLRSAEKVGFRFIADVTYRKVLNREHRVWRIIRHGNR